MKSHPGLGFVFARLPGRNKVWDIFLRVAFSFSWAEQSRFFLFSPRAWCFWYLLSCPAYKNIHIYCWVVLPLALWYQTCLHINLLCKSMLSEAEEIICSHPISQICFFLQADGLVRVSRCLSHAAGAFTPAGKWAASNPCPPSPSRSRPCTLPYHPPLLRDLHRGHGAWHAPSSPILPAGRWASIPPRLRPRMQERRASV